MEVEWNRVRALILSEKLSRKRDGIKELNLLLDSDEFLKAMDRCTLRIWAHDSVPAVSWPGLCSDLTKFLGHQIECDVDKRRGSDQNLGKLLKRVVRLADDKNRSGGRLMLLRRVRRLFDHVSKVLAIENLSAQIAADYTNILHNHLLPVAEYCSEAAASTFEELFDIHMKVIESIPKDNFERSYGSLLGLNLLVMNFPGDIPQILQRDLMFFFTEQIKHLHRIRDSPKTTAAFFVCVKNFLCEYGLDHLSHVSQLHQAVHTFVKGNLFLHQSSLLKDAIVDYLRVQLQLHGVQGVENAIPELYNISEEFLCGTGTGRLETSELGWSWGTTGTKQLMDKNHYSRAALAASLFFYMEHLKLHKAVVTEENRHKRQKCSSVHERLLNNLQMNTEAWGPVVCALLYQHASCLGYQFMQICLIWVTEYTERLSSKLVDAQLQENMPGVIWVLRAAYLLASVWPEISCGTETNKEWTKIGQSLMKLPAQTKKIQNEVINLCSMMFCKGLLPVSGIGGSELFQEAIYSRPVPDAVLRVLPLMASDTSKKSQNYQAYAECLVAGATQSTDPGHITQILGQLLNSQDYPTCCCWETVEKVWSSWIALDQNQLSFEEELKHMQHGCIRFRSLVFGARVRKTCCVSTFVRNSGRQLDIFFVHEILKILTNLPVAVEGLTDCKTLLRACLIAVLVLIWASPQSEQPGTANSLLQLEDELARRMDYLGPLVFSQVKPGGNRVDEVRELLNHLASAAVELDKHGKGCISKKMKGWILCAGTSFIEHYKYIISIDKREADSLTSSEGIFDIELDQGMKNKGSNSSGGAIIKAELSEDYLCFCLESLSSLARTCERAAWTMLQKITEHINLFEESPPDKIRCVLISSACIVGTMCKGDAIAEACEALQAEMDLSPAVRFPNRRIEFILDQLHSMILCQSPDSTLKTTPGLNLDTCLQDLDGNTWNALAGVLDGLVNLMRNGPSLETSCHKGSTRVKLGNFVQCFARREPKKYLADVEDMVLALMKDPIQGFMVRRQSIPFVCCHLNESRESRTYFENLQFAVLQRPSINSLDSSIGLATQGHIESEVEFLIACAIECNNFESDCLHILLSHAALYQKNFSLIESAVDLIWNSMGYPSRQAYLKLQQHRIVCLWFAKGRTLDQFLSLSSLFRTCDNGEQVELTAVLAEYKIPVVTCLATYGREDVLGSFAKMLGKSLKSIVKESLAHLLAALKIGIVCGTSDTRQSADNIFLTGPLSKVFSAAEISAFASERTVDIIEAILLRSSDAECSMIGCYPIKWIVHTIQSVIDVQKKFELKGPKACWLLLQIHKWISRARNAAHKRYPLSALIALMEVLGDGVCEDAVFRYTVQILLLLVRTIQLQPTVCRLIRQIFEKKADAAELNPLHWRELKCCLRHVASRITEYADMDSSSMSADVQDLISLLNTMVSRDELQSVLCELEPFPNKEEFGIIREAQATARQSTRLDNQISLFLQRNDQLTVSMKERTVSYLRKLLDGSRMDIYNMVCDNSASKYLLRCTWKLVALIDKEYACEDLCTLCAELMGLIGPFNPYTITLRAACGTSRISSWSRLLTSLPESSTDQATEALDAVIPRAVCFLLESLLDEDALIVECAQITLFRLLRVSAHQVILKNLQLVTQYKSLLEAYMSASPCSANEIARMQSTWKATNCIEDDIVWHVTDSSYDDWVCGLAQILIESSENEVLKDCQGMASMKAVFAELLMPFILHDLATAKRDNAILKGVLSHQISKFILPRADKIKKAAQLVLSCTEFLRHCHRDWAVQVQLNKIEPLNHPNSWSRVYWLELDYLLMSQVACQCSAFFTALVYIEHWCEAENGVLSLPDVCVDDLDQSKLPLADELLLTIYKSIDDVDGLCAVARTPHLACRLMKYEQKRDWQQSLTLYDLALSQNIQHTPQEAQKFHLGLTTSLQHLGWSSLLKARLSVLKGTSLWQQEFSEIESELSWRLGDWETHETSTQPKDGASFNSALHCALCNLKEGNEVAFLENVSFCRSGVVRKMAASAAESLAAVNPALVKLQMVDMVSEAWSLKWPQKGDQEALKVLSLVSHLPDTNNNLDAVESIWKTRQTRAGSEGRFDLMEPLLALHGVILKSIGNHDRLPNVLLRTVVHARQVGNLPASWRALENLKKIALSEKESCSSISSRLTGPDALWRLEEARLLWLCGEKTMAVQLGKSIIQKLKTHPGRFRNHILAEWLCSVGNWLADTKAVSSSIVMKMLTDASQAVRNQEHEEATWSGPVACQILFRLASYADARYQAIHAQRSSREWLMSKAVMEKKKLQIVDLQSQLKRAANSQVKSALMGNIEKLQRPVRADEQQAKTLEEDEARFLSIALLNFRRCLMAGNQHDLSVVFRLCQLWFRLASDADVNKRLWETFDEVPSYKFIPLVYQIASRMGASTDSPLHSSGFQPALHGLIARMAVDHPYHVLCQLFALKNGNLGSNGKIESGPVSIVMSRDVDLDKVEAAAQLLNELSTHPKIGEIVGQMSKIVKAYICLAAAKAPSRKITCVGFPKTIQQGLQDLHLIPILSKSMEVQRDGAYKFKHFRSFGPNIRFVGGINKPKLIACEDSDGRKHRELVKSGSDDLRQDAVMQQFFQLVNSLLCDCSETRKRKLNIVPYKVVPFSPGAGMLEWVEYTIPMSNYLLGADKKGGAHVRYKGEHDLTFAQCHHRLGSVNNPLEARREFDAICEQYHPVMHHFFLERYRDPASWFEKRLAYTRSTAVNSMAGYIIGLGDRHSSNILIKTDTAEVVHIDLGIAFEQGRFLTMPELVPFRLTRDIVDGMGINGVEGTMRKCCEEVIKVIRLNKEALLTIIEVFIHDPLYKWGITPIKARRRQREDSCADLMLDNSSVAIDEGLPAVGNADAERALLRVQKKIDGTEEGEPRGVEGQVQQLFQDAQDADNLASMFVGWAPWV